MKKLLTFLTAVLLGMTSLFATACDPDSFNYENGDKYTVGVAEVGANVTSLDIGWYMGKVCVEYAAVETITFSESAKEELTEEIQVHHWLDGNTLHIQYGKDGLMMFYGTPKEKTLTVLIPQETVLQKLEISSGSADIFVTDLHVNEVEIENTYGDTKVSFADVNEADINLIKGNGEATFATAPKEGEFSVYGGALTVKFPADTGFTAEMKKGNGTINCDFDLTQKGEEYISGDGAGQYDFEIYSSGTIHIQKL